jgi:polar amino acid transport system substrate-binding protein
MDAFAASGLDSELEWLPWARALRKTEKAQLNATFPWYKSKQREAKFLFSAPLASESTAIFYPKSLAFDWEKLQDLKPYRIGVNTDYFYSEAFSQAEREKSLNVTRVHTELQLIGMLLRGRLDIILMGKAPGENFIQQAGASAMLASHPKIFAHQELHVLFPKADPRSEKRLAAFNKGLRKVKNKLPKLALAY